MSTDALVQSPSSGYVYTSTFVSETSTSSTDSTSTGASSHVTVSAPSTKSAPAIVLACNSIAIIACALVLVAYVRLYREHRLLMRRTSLTLSCAMAASELLLHATNLARYLNLPAGFACAFIGGWLHAFPTLLSVFYSSCIALHSQLYFVFRREPKDADKGIYAMLKWYLILPVVASGVVCTTAHSIGFYGYSAIWGHCWYASPPGDPSLPPHVDERALIGITTTFTGWCILATIYLLVASATIAYVVFWKASSDVDFGGHIGLRRNRKSHASEGSTSASSAPENCFVGPWATSSMDGSTVCEGTLGGTKLGAGEVSLPLSPVDVGCTAKSDFLDRLGENDTDGPTMNARVADDDDRSPHGFPLPPKVHLGPLSRPPTLQFTGFHTATTASTQMMTTLFSAAHQPPSRQESSSVPSSSQPQHRPQRVSRHTLRAVALRLLGYILIPVFCIAPRAIVDLIIICHPAGGVVIPDGVDGVLNVLNGLIGLFNALLFFSDPVLLVVWAGFWVNRSWGVVRKQTRTTAGPHRGRDREAGVEESMDRTYPFSLQDVTTLGSGRVGSVRCTLPSGRLEERPRSTLQGLEA